MLKILFLIGVISFIYGDDITKYPPLFAEVMNLGDNETLSVRLQPNKNSKKIGYLPNEAIVKVYRCKKIKKDTWCKIGHMLLLDYEGYGDKAPSGWVNAKFLDPFNEGYVLINGRARCFYALKCKNGVCDVKINKKVRKIRRYSLLGVSRYRAGGRKPCEEKLTEITLPKDYAKSPKLIAHNVVSLLRDENIKSLAEYIHPKDGILLTYSTTFSKFNQPFNKTSFLIAYNSNLKLYWGKRKGKKVYLTLKEYLNNLIKKDSDYSDIGEVNPLGFDFPNPKGCIAFEVSWNGTNNHNWLGLVVVLKQYQKQWYVVGLLHNSWD